MKLSEFLAREGAPTHKAFGDLIGVSQAAISRYVKGYRFPDRETLARIHQATNGEVTPNDFVDLTPAEPSL